MSVYDDNVLLIHIPKCAGTSCRNYMIEHLPGTVVNSLKQGPLPIDSTPLRHIEEYTGRKLESWDLIVCPIRNPYAQVVSHWAYHWHRFAIGGRHIHDRCAAMKPALRDWLWEAHSDFRVWYEGWVRNAFDTLGGAMEYVSQCGFYEYYATIDGEVPPNMRIIDTSEIGVVFPKLLEPYVGAAHELPHARSSPHKPNVMEYHDDFSIRLVEWRFRWAFENYYDKLSREAA